jgi:polysaccharide pyruvyl transferase WcaK-like protein
VAKSDRTFYDDLAITPDGRLLELLAAGGTGPVVSVRLHGALQSVLAGVPAVHLGYERKSWGAYEDLGLGEYVHDARRFDPEAVAAQVRALQADPTSFWSAVAVRQPDLVAMSDRLTEDLRTLT